MCSFSHPILVRGFALASFMALALLLAGCGQSGPLYMPDKVPESQKPRSQRSGAAQNVPAPVLSTPADGAASTTTTP